MPLAGQDIYALWHDQAHTIHSDGLNFDPTAEIDRQLDPTAGNASGNGSDGRECMSSEEHSEVFRFFFLDGSI